MFKKIMSMLLCLMLTLGFCTGCESEEERQARIVNAVQTKMETMMETDSDMNELYSMMTNKEWTYSRNNETGEEYVIFNATVTYVVSMPVNIRFTIDTEEGYITYIKGNILGEKDEFAVPKNENSKLNL